jgi:hypothetical protein
MSLVAMAACYAPSSEGPVADVFPCHVDTGAFRDDIWRRWLAHDPSRLVDTYAGLLRGLGLLFLDAGARDDYGMHWGVRALHDALERSDVPHVYEEHDAGHHGIEHRFLCSLSHLTKLWGR